MGHLDVQDLINRVVLFFIPLIFSLSLHEWGHAATAVALGDQTPKEQGRLTINPVAHIDLLGTIIVPFVLIVLKQPPIAWAKPVQFTPYRFTRKIHLKTGLMLTSAAGPAMNLVLAVGCSLAVAAAEHFGHLPGGMRTLTLLRYSVELNVLLFLFNLIPVPPFDGTRVVQGLMPYSLRKAWMQLERFAPAFVAIFLFTGIGGTLIRAPTDALSDALYKFSHLIFR